MRRITLFVLAFPILLAMLVGAETQKREEAVRNARQASATGYISPTPGHIPIIAWAAVYDHRNPTRADFDTMVAGGFNCAMVSFSVNQMKDIMEDIDDLDVSLLYDLRGLYMNGIYRQHRHDNEARGASCLP